MHRDECHYHQRNFQQFLIRQMSKQLGQSTWRSLPTTQITPMRCKSRQVLVNQSIKLLNFIRFHIQETFLKHMAQRYIRQLQWQTRVYLRLFLGKCNLAQQNILFILKCYWCAGWKFNSFLCCKVFNIVLSPEFQSKQTKKKITRR